jgi:hypothetical protein
MLGSSIAGFGFGYLQRLISDLTFRGLRIAPEKYR